MLRAVCELTERPSANTGALTFLIPHKVNLGLHVLRLLAQNNLIGKWMNHLWHIHKTITQQQKRTNNLDESNRHYAVRKRADNKRLHTV